MFARLLALAFALAVTVPAGAREALDLQTMLAGEYRRSVDLSAYAPGADAKPPTHRFEGRLQLRGQPSLRTLTG